ncbi:DNA-directed RNA polymerase subunit B [Candidatus Woesearchaeota archaeon]|nr:DNA-directed RNA polymerase subunit B [Candidatus Woesearchaeota archaeon]
MNENLIGETEVFMDDIFVGSVEKPEEFIKKIKNERRMNRKFYTVNVYYDKKRKRIFIGSKKGRVLRPLIVVENGEPKLTEDHIKQLEKNKISWSDLINEGIIEYLDAEEEESALVAIDKEDLTHEHTHLEISPMDIFGLCTSLVPFEDHDHAVRLNQGSKNQKQAIGFYAANFNYRMDMDVNLLHYPQRPIVSTLTQDIVNLDKHPYGQNVVVAIMSYEGYNMEDAVVFNKSSIERGMARSTYYRPVSSEELKYSGGLMDDISIPDKDVKGYRSEKEYAYLEEDGLIYPEADVKEGDVIIGKTSPPRFLSSMDEYELSTSSRRESSIALKHGEKGVVDMVLLTQNEEGNKLVQVRLRNTKMPEIGDKFTSRHGQKGIIGLIVPEEDMPFTSSGIKPDIIFSPQGIPSRMTLGHMIELIAGKTGSMAGRYIDGTIFSGEDEMDIRKELENMGFREDGSEVMYDGITGRAYKSTIYIGNMYYLKLKHLVSNKLHSRSTGPIQLLTRQPTEGRANEGGLRLGEMEKDTLVAHGASVLLKERFDSDRAVFPICEKCGMVGVHDTRTNSFFCSVCGTDTEISNVEMSYSFKLMLDEFKSLCIYPKMELKSKLTVYDEDEKDSSKSDDKKAENITETENAKV